MIQTLGVWAALIMLQWVIAISDIPCQLPPGKSGQCGSWQDIWNHFCWPCFCTCILSVVPACDTPHLIPMVPVHLFTLSSVCLWCIPISQWHPCTYLHSLVPILNHPDHPSLQASAHVMVHLSVEPTVPPEPTHPPALWSTCLPVYKTSLQYLCTHWFVCLGLPPLLI